MLKWTTELSAKAACHIGPNFPGLSLVLGILLVVATGLFSDWTSDGRAYSIVVLLLSTFLAISVWLVLLVLTENRAERRTLDRRLDDFRQANHILAHLTDLQSKPGMRTLAEGELELFSDRLQGMRDGVFHKYVSLPSEQITELFVPLVDDLVPRKGTWETISVPSFWHERNVGSSRGFIEANSRAAEAGVTIDRVLVLDADPACLHSWQKRVLRVLFFEAAQHSERMLLKVVRVTDADINAPNFGIWDKQLVVEMDYSQYEGEHVRQFERIDVFTRRQTVKEFRHTFERWKECQMFGIEDVTEEARRIAEKIGEGNVEPPFAAGA